MKRIATLLLLLCVITLTVLISGSRAQDAARAHAKPALAQDGKIAIPCPAQLDDITDCPDTGCGPSVDPHLNRQKNIRSLDGEAEPMTIQEMKDLPDPVEGFEVGDTRETLQALGEGKKIVVVANALAVRKGSAESCNCKLTRVADTDNHIVLVDRVLRSRRGESLEDLLDRREQDSITAEFAPRPRLDLPHLKRTNLQPLGTYNVEEYSELTERVVQGQLDLYVEEVKKKREEEFWQGFSQALSPPIRAARTDISNLTLTRWGVLSFDVPYDRHEFSVGFSTARKLREALRNVGFTL